MLQKIRNKCIDNISLNEACSSGCGSFIETFARSMGYSIEEFCKLGLFAKAPHRPRLTLHGVHELLGQSRRRRTARALTRFPPVCRYPLSERAVQGHPRPLAGRPRPAISLD